MDQSLYKKPRGRPPKNKKWDQINGKWILDISDEKKSNEKIVNINNQTEPDKKETNILSWNINGIRSMLKPDVQIYQNKSFEEYLVQQNSDIICFTETKISKENDVKKVDSEILLDYQYRFWNCCTVKGGYSGTAIFSKNKPKKVEYGLNNIKDPEGRLIILFFDKFILVNVYTPNSGDGLVRLRYRIEDWDVKFRNYMNYLNSIMPVIICGDLNCAYQEIDLHNPKTNTKSAGFTKEERESFSFLLEKGFTDIFRYLYPFEKKYSFWSNFRNSRAKNIGWRIDYFLVSDKLRTKVISSDIEDQVFGSDHAPIKLKICL